MPDVRWILDIAIAAYLGIFGCIVVKMIFIRTRIREQPSLREYSSLNLILNALLVAILWPVFAYMTWSVTKPPQP